MDVSGASQKRHAMVKALVYAAIMILLLSLTVWATAEASKPKPGPHNFLAHEKLAIQGPSLENPTSLSVTVFGVGGIDDQTVIEIAGAMVRDTEGNRIGEVYNMEANPILIPMGGNQTTFKINLSPSLPSGQMYSVTLLSKRGGSFVSPLFTAP